MKRSLFNLTLSLIRSVCYCVQPSLSLRESHCEMWLSLLSLHSLLQTNLFRNTKPCFLLSPPHVSTTTSLDVSERDFSLRKTSSLLRPLLERDLSLSKNTHTHTHNYNLTLGTSNKYILHLQRNGATRTTLTPSKRKELSNSRTT